MTTNLMVATFQVPNPSCQGTACKLRLQVPSAASPLRRPLTFDVMSQQNLEQVMPTYEAVTPLIAFDGFTNSGDFRRVAVEHLRMLDGLEYNEEDFVEYLEEPLASVVLKSSGIKLSLNGDNGQLTAITFFETAKELNEHELAQISAYYFGQMADGIGENLLSEIQSRDDVGFRLEVFGLYDESMKSQLRRVT